MLTNNTGLNPSPLIYKICVGLIILAGVVVRLAHFPNLPPGFNQDEASSAYEAYSLLHTGADRWGNPFPAYFPSWGTGQNVLLSYLMIPFIKLFGLNITTARIVPLILGILALPLFYLCLRPLGRFAALAAVLVLGFAPWHFMMSHWALESNLAPFFMLWGCYTLSRAVIRQKGIVLSLAPFALALYGYGTTAVVLPLFFLLVLLMQYQNIRSQKAKWLLASAVFFVIAAPFLLFFIENYILHRDMPWTKNLFFSTPYLLNTRLAQLDEFTAGELIEKNWNLALSGFNDKTNYNLLQEYALLYPVAVFLGVVGMIGLLYCVFTKKREEIASSEPGRVFMNVFLAWIISSLVLFFFVDLNINRFNHFFFPCLALGIWFVDKLIKNLRTEKMKVAACLVFAGGIAFNGLMATLFYLDEYADGPVKSEFSYGLQEVMAAGKELPATQVRITDHVPLNYIYTVFYMQYSPVQFQKEVVYTTDGNQYRVCKVGKYVFCDEYLDRTKPYGYVSFRDEYSADSTHTKNATYANDTWEAGVISPK